MSPCAISHSWPKVYTSPIESYKYDVTNLKCKAFVSKFSDAVAGVPSISETGLLNIFWLSILILYRFLIQILHDHKIKLDQKLTFALKFADKQEECHIQPQQGCITAQ